MATDKDFEDLLAPSSCSDDSNEDSDTDTDSFTMLDALIVVARLSSEDDEFEEEEQKLENPDMMMREKPSIFGGRGGEREKVVKTRTRRWLQPVLDISRGERKAREEEELRSSKKKVVTTTLYQEEDISREERMKRESMLKKPMEEKRVDKNKYVKNILPFDLNEVYTEEWFETDKMCMNGNKRISPSNSEEEEEEEEEEQQRCTKKSKTSMSKNIKKKKGWGWVCGSSSGSCYGSDQHYPNLNLLSPPLPAKVRKLIEEEGGMVEEAVLVIQKKLTNTDLSNRHNRLAVPVNQVREEFLTEKEKKFLNKKIEVQNDNNKKKDDDKTKKANNKTESIEVRIIMPSHERESITLGRWVMSKGEGKACCELYVLKGAWNQLREKEKKFNIELEKNMVVQLWAYRVNGGLRFALVNLGKVEPGSGNISANSPNDATRDDDEDEDKKSLEDI